MSNLRAKLKARKRNFRTTTVDLDDMTIRLREPSLAEITAINAANALLGAEGLDAKFRAVCGLMVNDDGTPFNGTAAHLDETLESFTTAEFLRMDAQVGKAFRPDTDDDEDAEPEPEKEAAA